MASKNCGLLDDRLGPPHGVDVVRLLLKHRVSAQCRPIQQRTTLDGEQIGAKAGQRYVCFQFQHLVRAQSVSRSLATAERPLGQGTTFPPQAYTDPDHYQFEVANILRREWLSVGHVSQVPKPGDYFNLELLGEPMVVVLSARMTLCGLLSRVCPHRGWT